MSKKIKKFALTITSTSSYSSFTTIIEAESKEDALEQAKNNYSPLTHYFSIEEVVE